MRLPVLLLALAAGGAAAAPYYAPFDESCHVKRCSPGDLVFVYSTQDDPAHACYAFKGDACFTPRHNQRVRIEEVRGADFMKVKPLDSSRAFWIAPESLMVKALKPED